MSDLNPNPYTVTEERQRKGSGFSDWSTYVINCGGKWVHHLSGTSPGEANQLANLLNAAYAKGVETERATAMEASLHLTAELTRLAADVCAYGKRHDDGRLAVCLRSDLEFVAKAIEQHGHVEQKVKDAYHRETIRLELARQPEVPKVNPS